MIDQELSTSFQTLVRKIKQPENYIQRNYKTIGGMWTVDTWHLNGCIYQVMDEGYTQRISTEQFKVTKGYNGESYIDLFNISPEQFVEFVKDFT